MQAPQDTDRNHSVVWFVVVGCASAAVHWSVVVLLVDRLTWRPLVANVAGWAVAVVVSFVGHSCLSFRGHGVPMRASALRFVAVSATGFAVNEVSYALLLRATGHRYDFLLGAVLIGLAFFTYWASRHWTFLRTPPST